MAKVVNFKNNLRFYFNLIDKRKEAGDLWGVLDATRSAMVHARTKVDRRGLNLLMGQTYFEMGQYMLSCEHFFCAVSVPHLRSAAFFGVARNLICIPNFDLALEYLEATLKWDVSNTFTGAVLEWSSVMKKKMKEPGFATEKLLRSAKILLAQQEWEKADEILKNMQPSAEIVAHRAFCAFLKKEYARSRELGFAALELDAQNVVARCVLAELAKEDDNSEELQTHLDAMEENPTESGSELLKIALLFASLGEYDKSLKFLEKLQNIDEFNAKNHLFCALCCHNLKREEDALFHISRAHWLDFENPLYVFFYNLIKTGELPDQVLLKNQLSPPFQAEKLENLNALLYGGDFCQELCRSHFLLEDLEWSFSLRDESLTDATSFALASCSNKKSLGLVSKLLLSPRPSPKQKFLIARNALLSDNFFNLDFVCSLRYSSISVGKKELRSIPKPNIRRAVCNAISYAECFYACQFLIKEITKRTRQILKCLAIHDAREDELTCLLLSGNPQVLEGACYFFGVEKNRVINLKKLLTLTESEGEK